MSSYIRICTLCFAGFLVEEQKKSVLNAQPCMTNGSKKADTSQNIEKHNFEMLNRKKFILYTSENILNRQKFVLSKIRISDGHRAILAIGFHYILVFRYFFVYTIFIERRNRRSSLSILKAFSIFTFRRLLRRCFDW